MLGTSEIEMERFIYSFRSLEVVLVALGSLLLGFVGFGFPVVAITDEIPLYRAFGATGCILVSLAPITLSVITGHFVWQVRQIGRKAITFTDRGIILPRTRFSTKDEFVPYEEIERVMFVLSDLIPSKYRP